jgi:predicted dehydrogenase
MRIGLIGCGPWGANILRDLQTLGCEVLVVARSSSSAARAEAGEATVVVRSIGELDKYVCDGYVVTTEATNHAHALRELISRGKPIFVEKPIVTTVSDVEDLAAQKTDLIFVMDKWRYHPGVKVLAELAGSGSLGDVYGIRTRRNQWGNPHPDCDSPWTLLPHDLAIVEELIGGIPALNGVEFDASPTEVFGVVARFGTRPWVVVECFSRAPRPEREVLVLGSKGTAVLGNGYSEEVLHFSNGVVEPKHIPAAGEWPLLAELREFVGYLGGGRAPRSTFNDGARHVRVIAEILAWSR